MITPKIFKRIYNKCPKLYHLELESIVSFALTIQKLPKNLKHLGFRHCQFSFFSLFVKKVKNNSRLDDISCLDLSYSTNFDSQCCMLCNKFPQLRYLYLEGLFRQGNSRDRFLLNLTRLVHSCRPKRLIPLPSLQSEQWRFLLARLSHSTVATSPGHRGN